MTNTDWHQLRRSTTFSKHPMTEPLAYLNGRFVPVSQASLHVFDLGVVGGASVTEMVRTFRHVPFRIDQHLDRLEQSIPELKSICERIVAENSRLIPESHDLGLILFVTAGENPTYVGRTSVSRPRGSSVCVHSFPLPFELWADKYETGVHLATVTTKSIPDDVVDASIKHRSRLHWHLADREAKKIDPSASAVLTSEKGFLTETATGNVWWVKQGVLATPARNILKGISRDVIFELNEQLHLPCAVNDFDPAELATADEAFVTSTPLCLQPVTRFNCNPIGNGKPGPVTLELLRLWGEMVGVDIARQMREGAAARRDESMKG
jgi:branched-subunit amino acid aminotransferase/4-amino-4-deoxychorismate lyase